MSVAAQHVPSSTSLDSVFPLPLTILESFLVLDSQPDYPMLCEVEVVLQGRVDRTAMEAAIAFALARNPLLRSLIERQERGEWTWVLGRQTPPVFWSGLDGPLGERYGRLMDLTAEPGLRIWIRHDDDSARILLEFHHACSDGIGSFGFIEDLLAGYANAVPGGEPVEPRPIEPERLTHRGEVGIGVRTIPQQIMDAWIGIFEGVKFVLQRPLSLAPGGAERPVGGVVQPGFITATCPVPVAAGVRLAGRLAGCTTNDVLLRDLFQTLKRWNTECGRAPGGRRLRILMPQNLRGPDDGPMPAANVMSFAFLTRRAKLCERPGELLQSIRIETDAIKRGLLSLYFIGGLASLLGLGILPWLLRRRLCFATVVLSNLSYPSKRFVARFPNSDRGLIAGNLVLADMLISPPLRPQTHAAFGVMNSAETITFSLRVDPRTLTPEDARQLLDSYVAQLTTTANGAHAAK